MVDIFAAPSVLKTASEAGVKIREALKSRNVKPDEISGILDSISDARSALINVQEELARKNAEIQALNDELRLMKAAVNLRDSIVFHHEAAWRSPNQDGPFCPGCASGDQVILHKAQITGVHDGFVEHVCTRYGNVNRVFYVPEDLVAPSDLAYYKLQ